MNLSLEILIILLLILANGVLALAEIAIVSARKARLQQRAEDGDQKAMAALRLAGDPTDFLSTVQIGITLVGVLAGAFGGATIAEQLAGWLGNVAILKPYAEALGVAIVVAVITYFSLVLGELAPKRVALNDPERYAAWIAPTMQRLSRLTSPLVRLLSASTSLILRLIGVKPTGEPPVTEEEIKVMIDQGTQAGVFAEAEQDMLVAVLRLGDRRVDTLMTPRTDIVWLDIEDSLEKNLAVVRSNPQSRYPLGQGSLDNVLGIIMAHDLLALSLSSQPIELTRIMKEALFVPESMPSFKVLDIFRQTHEQVALVLDEYGGLQGLVTAFDILEAIVGEFPEGGGVENIGVTRRADGSVLIDGRLPVDELKDALAIAELPGEERGYYQTSGGFVMTVLGRIPKPTDQFSWAGWTFEVVDMDGRRVDKVLATRVKTERS
jgi:putative hemolysin